MRVRKKKSNDPNQWYCPSNHKGFAVQFKYNFRIFSPGLLSHCLAFCTESSLMFQESLEDGTQNSCS